jgi:flavin-dependent dehydrogenase
MIKEALIIGSGIAGLTCAKLLSRHGWKVNVHDLYSSSPQVLLLNKTTCDLLLDIWQTSDNIFAGSSNVIKEYKIRWGTQEMPSIIKEPSVVIRKDRFIERLIEKLIDEQNVLLTINNPCDYAKLLDYEKLCKVMHHFRWTIDATGRASSLAKAVGSARHYSFGRRSIISTEVEMKNATNKETIWLETIDEGWVFLAPLEGDKGVLQLMLPVNQHQSCYFPLDYIKNTKTIKFQVSHPIGYVSAFEACPRITEPLCGSNWIAVGDAAASFDPLSGEGIGYAIREAILATAIIKGISSGLSEDGCLRHYSRRLHNTFSNHLKECYSYYSKAFHSKAWNEEIECMSELPSSIFSSNNALNYRIHGFDLEPV